MISIMIVAESSKVFFKKIKAFFSHSNNFQILLFVAYSLLLNSRLCLCDTNFIENGIKRDLTDNLLNLTALHAQALNNISTENIRESLSFFARAPHFGGTKENYQQALEIKARLLRYGFDKAEIKKYNVLLSVPGLPGSVTIKDDTGAEIFRTSVFEKVLDPSENNTETTVPYNAFSPSGSVKGKLVYAYFGRAKDFKMLEEQGVNVTGKIAIIRYGRGNRATKIYRAAEEGAVGVILYPDPEEYAPEGLDKVYPNYIWLPSTAIPRGTVRSTKTGSGDLLTPGFPSIDGIYRIPLSRVDEKIPKIPVLPISYGDAERLISTLTGKLPSSKWKGGLPITYGVQTDPSDNRVVTLTVNTQLVKRDIHNVIGYIRGYEEPDQLVILGNHRDAWVFGGTDPSSGTAVIMEAARVLGTLMNKGWKPRRTIVFGSWDAEEIGLIGSTEWIEEHAKILKSRAVAYINVDTAIDGNFTFLARSMPLLKWAIIEATKKVPSPDGVGSVFDQWIRTSARKDDKSLPKILNLHMDSDYAAFYNLLGVPSADLRYSYDYSLLGDHGNPLYHTLHDTFRLLDKFIDPTFKYHQATSRVVLQVLLSLADSKIIPFNISQYANDIKRYYDSVVEDLGKTLNEHMISLESLMEAVNTFIEAAKKFEEIIKITSESDVQNIRLINSRLTSLEKAFIYAGDHPILPDTTSRRHVLESRPRFGKVNKMMGIYNAVEQARQGKGSWEEVKQQISIVIYSLISAKKLLSLTPI